MGPSIVIDGEGFCSSRTVASIVLQWAVDRHRRRVPHQVNPCVIGRAASMGPSIVIDGESSIDIRAIYGAPRSLQWGRRSSSTERRSRPARAGPEGHASMGPSIVIDGECELIAGDDESERVLQWGRRSSSTESSRAVVTLGTGFGALQWGRRSSSTESPESDELVDDSPSRASMGPSIVIDGEQRTPRAMPLTGSSLQWGRRSSSTERHHQPPEPRGARQGFNGAVDRHRRRERLPQSVRAVEALQWGRRSSSTER